MGIFGANKSICGFVLFFKFEKRLNIAIKCLVKGTNEKLTHFKCVNIFVPAKSKRNEMK